MSLLRKRGAPSDAEGEGAPAEKLPKPAAEPVVLLAAAASSGSECGTGQFTPVVGDLIEAVYANGCWVPAVVLALRARQVQVDFELPQPEQPRRLLAGAHCYCEEDDTVRDIARRFGLPPAAVLQLNQPYYDRLTTTAKLRRDTLLAVPLVLAARENDTPRSIASEHDLDLTSLLDHNCAFIPELLAGSKLKENTLLLLPENVPPPQVKGAPSPMPCLAADVEVPEPEGGGGWRKAQVRQILGGLRFGLAVEGSDDDVHVVKLLDHETTWRWPAGSVAPSVGAAASGKQSNRPVAVGDEIEVEVDEEGRTRWRGASVRAILPGGTFQACVDGDEDFVEEYEPHEENTEWRWPPVGRPRAREWVAAGFTRPRPPVAPPGFLLFAAGGGTVQVLQDGGWWQANLADDELLPKSAMAHDQGANDAAGENGALGAAPPASPGGAVSCSDATGVSAASVAAKETVYVFLLSRDTDTYLRVRVDRVRPDWELKDGKWRVVPPQNASTIEASVSDGSPLAGLVPSGFPRPMIGGLTGASGFLSSPSGAPGMRIGEPLSAWAWATASAHAEVSLSADVARGAWWTVQLLELQQQGALVSYEAFAEKDGSHARLQEWVPWSRARPRPPATPADFLDATRVGEAVQLWWEDAWWDATLLRGPGAPLPLLGQSANGASADTAGTGSVDHLRGVALSLGRVDHLTAASAIVVEVQRAKGILSGPQTVPCSRVRPGWHWRRFGGSLGEGEWEAPCIAPVGLVHPSKVDVCGARTWDEQCATANVKPAAP
jgi:hypothetical protein